MNEPGRIRRGAVLTTRVYSPPNGRGVRVVRVQSYVYTVQRITNYYERWKPNGNPPGQAEPRSPVGRSA